jgi:hypothetical protein
MATDTIAMYTLSFSHERNATFCQQDISCILSCRLKYFSHSLRDLLHPMRHCRTRALRRTGAP